MARAFSRAEVLPSSSSVTTKLGIAGTANNYNANDIGKIVKVIGDSAYGLCAAGDPIEAYIVSMDAATAQGFSIGSIQEEDSKFVTCDGLQGTPGTGTIAVGDYLVTGTVVARNTALTEPVRVCKATSQAVGFFNWRVVGFRTGSGAVGSVALMAQVG